MPNQTETTDTILAISTPPGRGGIGIVRLAGPRAVEVAEALLLLRQSLRAPESHARAQFARVLDVGRSGEAELGGDPSGAEAPRSPDSETAGLKPRPFKTREDFKARNESEVLDEAVVTVFHAPHSYTGDDLVEIAAHGSPVVLEAIVRAALEVGERMVQREGGPAGGTLRLAGPGEFTQRAFLSGRLDLTQAEAVHDLIAAQTLDQARVAAQQMGGALSRRVAPAKEKLLHLVALLEAGMDFASGELDDVEVVPPTEIAAAIQSVEAPLAALEATFQRGQLLRNGAAIALVGRPNAGKSSLFNRLLERERAIVTPVPGTTRDTLEEAVSVGGIPLRLIDTAGLHGAASDEVEAMGMERTHEALADADLVLHIKDVADAGGEDDGWTPSRGSDRPWLVVQNKIDLLPQVDAGNATGGAPDGDGVVRTSALTGEGMDALRAAILDRLQASGPLAETGLLNNLRQRQAVTDALAALGAASQANEQGLPHEVLLLDLHAALRALDSLTGFTTAEDILARIFSTFCIGK